MQTEVAEIADGIFRLSTFVHDIAPPEGAEMKRLIVGIVGLAIASHVGAATSERMDLVCTGAAVTNAHGKVVDKHFRLDLAAKKWCDGDCQVVRDIADVQPTVIHLRKATEAEQEQGLEDTAFINRQTGEYVMLSEFIAGGGKATLSEESMCKPAPFSGFPQVKTAF